MLFFINKNKFYVQHIVLPSFSSKIVKLVFDLDTLIFMSLLVLMIISSFKQHPIHFGCSFLLYAFMSMLSPFFSKSLKFCYLLNLNITIFFLAFSFYLQPMEMLFFFSTALLIKNVGCLLNGKVIKIDFLSISYTFAFLILFLGVFLVEEDSLPKLTTFFNFNSSLCGFGDPVSGPPTASERAATSGGLAIMTFTIAKFLDFKKEAALEAIRGKSIFVPLLVALKTPAILGIVSVGFTALGFVHAAESFSHSIVHFCSGPFERISAPEGQPYEPKSVINNKDLPLAVERPIADPIPVAEKRTSLPDALDRSKADSISPFGREIRSPLENNSSGLFPPKLTDLIAPQHKIPTSREPFVK